MLHTHYKKYLHIIWSVTEVLKAKLPSKAQPHSIAGQVKQQLYAPLGNTTDY